MKRLLDAPVPHLSAALLLLAPLLLRAFRGSPLLPGPRSYTHLLGGPLPYDWIATSLGNYAVILSVLLGILSLHLFLLVARRHLSAQQQLLATILFVINPLFLNLFTGLSPATVAVPLLLLALLLPRWAALFLPLAALFSPGLALLLLALLLVIRFRKPLLLLAPALLLLLVAIGFRQPHIPAELGGSGFSFLFATLALFESAATWAEGKQRRVAALFLLLFLLSFISGDARLAVGLTAPLLIARFVTRLLRRRWAVVQARDVTLLLLGCLLLFAALSTLAAIVLRDPGDPLAGALAVIDEPGRILAPPGFAAAVSSLSGHEAVGCPERCVELDRIYRERSLVPATDLLAEEGIVFIVVTEEMRRGLVWQRDEEGLLFLLAHSDRFSLVAEEDGVELWRVTA